MQKKEMIEKLNENLVMVKNAISYVSSASYYSRNNVTIINCDYAKSSLRELEENLTGLINELSKKEEHDKDFSNKDLSM